MKDSIETMAFNSLYEKQMYLKNHLNQTLINDFEQYAFIDNISVSDNPTLFNNAIYHWIIKYDLSAYDLANIFEDKIKGVDVFDVPLWCMARMGQSETKLPNGNIILIGGEYEDYYDPQFCIFNDVIIKHPNDTVDVFFYPKEIFKPTDFHTATLLDDKIWIIGGLGYINERQSDITPIYQLSLDDYSITAITPKNHIGGIYEHDIEIKDDKFYLTNGILYDDKGYFDNIDTFVFDTDNLTWKNITNHQYQYFRLSRQDNDGFHDFELSQVHFNKDYHKEEYQSSLSELINIIGKEPDWQLYENRFTPNIEHKIIETDDYHRHCIVIDGIKVFYQLDFNGIDVYIYGKLDKETLTLLQNDLVYKWSGLENCPCVIDGLNENFDYSWQILKDKLK